ncbi:unnamed protein product [Pleuronectes platessa]|uniref:Uncharacterized protein n=1 Tax=Pleuronectes platessa TaxID=8262 RepID=A0A9N7VWA0_PLEPL|nr:unnamed protein product [Pleuronectes platessa]
MQMGQTGDRTADLQVGGQPLYPSATAAHKDTVKGLVHIDTLSPSWGEAALGENLVLLSGGRCAQANLTLAQGRRPAPMNTNTKSVLMQTL